MPAIGMNISGIEAKKKEDANIGVKVNTNTDLKDCKEHDLAPLNKKCLSIDFEFATTYMSKDDKKIAEIIVSGDVLFFDENYKKILEQWEKEKKLPDALNDVLISTGAPSKIIYTQIFKDKKPILKGQTDGLIISTQTGSTGYSLSAGGPVLDKDVSAFVLTPICSLTVFHSLVFSAHSKVSIKVIRPKKSLIIIDGNYKHFIESKNPILTVSNSENVASFIRFEDDFYHRLRSRLLFKGMG